MKFVVDKDEKIYLLEGKVKKLKAGDYSVLGYEDIFAIELKRTNDWLSWVAPSGKVRRERQLAKMSKLMYSCVLVIGHVGCGNRWVRAEHSIRVAGELAARGIPVLFAPDESMGRKVAVQFLKEAEKQYKKYLMEG